MVYKNTLGQHPFLPTFTLTLLFFIIPSNSVKFVLDIPGLERQCFYEVLNQAQKYSMETVPKNHPKYQVQISQSDGGTWRSVYYKMANIGYERMQVHKLSVAQTTYAFCIKNIERDQLQISVKFQTGIELLQFELLPDKSDAENLQREVTWLEGQKSNLYEIIKKVQQQKVQNTTTSTLLSTKMMLFAIIGLVSIVVVNFLFFKQMKNILKKRKLI